MARFAALYADRVVVQSPFHRHEGEISTLDDARLRLANDLIVIHYLRPLLEAGIVAVAEPALAFCEEHAPPIIKSGTLNRAARVLTDTFSKDVALTARTDRPVVYVEGPDTLIEHGSMTIVFTGDADLERGKRIDTEGRVRVIGTTRKDVINSLTAPILNDLVQQDVHRAWYGLSYLTDRPIDIQVLESLSDAKTARFGKALFAGFQHSLPFIERVPLKQLVELRANEAESFEIYRGAVTTALRELAPGDERRISEAFADLVQPELNRIDLAVSNAKRNAKGSMAANAVFGAGLLGVGVASGLLAPDAAKIIAAVGGFQCGMNVLKGARSLLTSPASVRDNDFYFLWRVRQHSHRVGRRPAVKVRE